MRYHLAAAALLAAASAHAEPLSFTPAEGGSQETQIVSAKFPKLAEDKSVKVTEAVTPLDSTKTGSLVVRFVSPDTCEGTGKDQSCRTVVLRASDSDWDVVFDRKAKTLELGEMGYGTMRRLIVDKGLEEWTWGGTRYKMDLAGMGTPVALKPAPAASVALLVQQFGDAAKRLYAGKKGVTASVQSVKLNPGSKTPQIVVRLAGPGICGVVLGCPWRVLEVRKDNYVTLLDGYGTDKIAVLPFARSGWRDIGATTPKGFVVFGWDGKSYSIANKSDGGGASAR